MNRHDRSRSRKSLGVEHLEQRLVLNGSPTLTIADVLVREDEATVQIYVTVDQAVPGGFSVDYNTLDHQAREAFDYASTSGSLTFQGDANETQSFLVRIQDDMLLELSESFYVALSNVRADEVAPSEIDASDVATVTILDKEREQVSLVRGETLQHVVAVTNSENDENVVLSADSLPTWLSLTDHGDGTATLSGTPGRLDVGGHSVTVHAQTDTGRTATLDLDIGVLHPVAEASADLLAEFDQTLAWMDQNGSVRDGYVVSDRHTVELEFIALDSDTEYSNVPDAAAFAATDTVHGYHVLLNSSQDRIYVSASGDFADAMPIAPGEETPLRRYYFEGVQDSRIQLRYAWLYDNTDYTEALLHVYELTGKSEYLVRARESLLGVIDRLEGDFRYVRLMPPGANNFYTGMAQGLILQAVDSYLRVSPQGDAVLEDAIVRLSEAFEHTTQGVWNQANNSYIGWIIANRTLGVTPDIPDDFYETMEEFHEQITDLEGRIPYLMNKSDSRYPRFRPTYLTYDTMKLARLSSMLPEPLPVMEMFAEIHTISQEVNYNHYAARNMYSLMWANLGSGYVDDAFAASQEELLRGYNNSPPVDNKTALGRLQMTAGLLKYHAQREAPPALSAADSFESGDLQGGSGWASEWVVDGDADITTRSPHSGQYQAVLRRGTGDLIRTVDTTEFSAVKVSFWGRFRSFESTDKAWVKVSSDGANWITLREFGDGEDDDQHHYYEFDVTTTGDTLYVRFEAGMSGSKDYWYIDDVQVVSTALAGDPPGNENPGSDPPAGDPPTDDSPPTSENPPSGFVIVDGSEDRRFEYNPDGTSSVSYELTDGNGSPKGVAVDSATGNVFVIDGDDHVYVSDANGNHLRSWKASGLKRPTGITTDGTNLWIVDSKKDMVYYFEGGASRTTDAFPTSTFSLDRDAGNKHPEGITFGVSSGVPYLWVLDADDENKIFRYELNGTPAGSWSLDESIDPTGITVDPANANDVWISDNKTDSIYRYAGAASRTSGSQAASSVIALHSDNRSLAGISRA